MLGVVFSMNGSHFNSSKVNRCFGYSKIDVAYNTTGIKNEFVCSWNYEMSTPNVTIHYIVQGELF